MARAQSPTRYKVGRVLEEHDLQDLRSDLPVLWSGDRGHDVSLRDLADQVNLAVLEAALEREGASPLDGEVENYYRLLTDDEVHSGTRTKTVRTLEREGLDVEAVTDDFVTHQAVHTYLREYCGVEPSDDSGAEPRKSVQRFRSRLQAVVADSVERLKRSGGTSIGEYTVLVDINVICEECGTHLSIGSLFAGENCNCD